MSRVQTDAVERDRLDPVLKKQRACLGGETDEGGRFLGVKMGREYGERGMGRDLWKSWGKYLHENN